MFGTYLRPALDKAHFVHLKMHSLDNTAWARYFVTYFRQYLLTEVGSRLQPVSALNFIPRQAFKQLQDNDDIELYGIYIIVEHKQGNAPFYTYWKREFKTKNARATPDYNGLIGDRFNDMCEWANEARGIIFNEPKLYADSTSKRRHMTTFATQNKEYHVMNSWAFPQNEVVIKTRVRISCSV